MRVIKTCLDKSIDPKRERGGMLKLPDIKSKTLVKGEKSGWT